MTRLMIPTFLTLVGTFIGLLSPGEQWKAVPLNTVRTGPSSDGGMTIGYAIRF